MTRGSANPIRSLLALRGETASVRGASLLLGILIIIGLLGLLLAVPWAGSSTRNP